MRNFLSGICCVLLATGAASGENAVQELLLTPPEKISAIDCSDDEFFTCYATAIRSDMEHYIASCEEEVSKKHADQMLRAADALISTARQAYDTSFVWAEKHLPDNRQDFSNAFRNMLRSRLLLDLYLLHDTESPWCSGVSAERKLNLHSLPASELHLLEDLQGVATYDDRVIEQLRLYHTAQVSARRNMLCELMRKIGTSPILFNYFFVDVEMILSDKDNEAQEFLDVEKIWDAYYGAICRAHTPVNDKEDTRMPLLGQVAMTASQEQRLAELTDFFRKSRSGEFLINFGQFKTEEDYLREIVRSSTLTPEQKLELYTKAQGVEKLLRTPTTRRDTQGRLWTDDEFFHQYSEAIRHDMNTFIAEELKSDYYLIEYGQEQSDRDASKCLRLADELIQRARTAYRASLDWFEHELTIFGHQWEGTEKLQPQFRVALHNRLLRDLFSLGQNEANRWVGSIRENQAQGSCLKKSFPTQFEAALSARGWSTTPGFAEGQHNIYDQQQSCVERYRNYILHKLYEIATPEERQTPPPSMHRRLTNVFRALFPKKTEHQELQLKPYAQNDYRKAAELFLKAEQAWDEYMKTLRTINYPISNNYFSGSGVSGWCLECANGVLDSHNSYLLYLMRFAGNGNFPYSYPIDFAEFDFTEEAADASNKLPG